jgi:PIN domain nuclease of toxin-antitoxin system
MKWQSFLSAARLNLLLDTHIAIWAVSEPEKLSKPCQELLLSTENRVFFSIVNLIEIAIKWHSNRRDKPPFNSQRAHELLTVSGVALAPLDYRELEMLERLADIHRDPFDRLLIAQALAGGYRLVTSDKTVASYSSSIMLV